MRIIFVFLFYQTFLISQTNGLPELIVNEIYVENSRVYNINNQWVFIEEICSDIRLDYNAYELNKNFTLENLTPDYSTEQSLKYKYLLCEFFEFKKKSGLIAKRTFLVKDISYFKNIKETKFDILKRNIKKEYRCNIKDIFPENIIYTTNLFNKSIVVEKIDQYYYLSIIDENCGLYERIKTHINSFVYLETDEYFILKGDKLFILFTVGD